MKQQQAEKPKQKKVPVRFVDPILLKYKPHVRIEKYNTIVKHDLQAMEQTIEKYYTGFKCSFKYVVVRSLPTGKRLKDQWWDLTPPVNDFVARDEAKDDKPAASQ